MPRKREEALVAALALSKSLSLPSEKGSVFAWHDSKGERLVISADTNWVLANRTIPRRFHGYPVVVEDRLHAIAQSSHRV